MSDTMTTVEFQKVVGRSLSTESFYGQALVVFQERDRYRSVVADLLQACKGARDLYDDMSLGPLGTAAKYGPDYEPPTDEDWLGMRGALEAAIEKAEAP